MTTDNPACARTRPRTRPRVLLAKLRPPARGRRPPSAIRTAINRQALALAFGKQERDRLTAHYWHGGKLADDLGQR